MSLDNRSITGADLVTCESIIEVGLQTFYDVGHALAHIRDAELYRAHYITFQAYLKERWGLSSSYASRLITGSEVVDSMKTLSVAPSNLGVAEELVSLPSASRTEVWNEAVETTARMTNGRPDPTASEVQELVRQKLARVSPKGAGRHEPIELSDDDRRTLESVRDGCTLVVNLRTQGTLIAAAEAEGLLARVDRSSRWGNPFLVDADGSREKVIAAYRDSYLPHKPSLTSRLAELRGKLLACWCAPEGCHADVLAVLANAAE